MRLWRERVPITWWMRMSEDDYVKTLRIGGKEVKLGLNDAGQCYYLEWEEDGETKEMGLGAYNFHYMEEAYYLFDERYKELSKKDLFGELSDAEWLEYCRYHDMFDKEYENADGKVDETL